MNLAVYCLLFTAVGVGFILVHLIAGKVIRPNRPGAEKGTIYECGEPTIGSAWIQFDLRFYVVALLFVIFDVEVAFFFPWAEVFGRANDVAALELPAPTDVAGYKEYASRVLAASVVRASRPATRDAYTFIAEADPANYDAAKLGALQDVRGRVKDAIHSVDRIQTRVKALPKTIATLKTKIAQGTDKEQIARDQAELDADQAQLADLQPLLDRPQEEEKTLAGLLVALDEVDPAYGADAMRPKPSTFTVADQALVKKYDLAYDPAVPRQGFESLASMDAAEFDKIKTYNSVRGQLEGEFKAENSAAVSLSWMAFCDILVFFGVLLVGFAYLWRRGDLAWVRSVAAERTPAIPAPPPAPLPPKATEEALAPVASGH